MDCNPIALVDPWGAATEGEKSGAQQHADNYKAETGNSSSTDPNDGYVSDDIDVTPPSATANTPVNNVCANDATEIVHSYLPSMEEYIDMNLGQRISYVPFDGPGGWTLWSMNASGNGEFSLDSNSSSGGLDVTSIDDIFSYFRDGSRPGPGDLRTLAEIIDKVINIYNEGSSLDKYKYHLSEKIVVSKEVYQKLVALQEQIHSEMYKLDHYEQIYEYKGMKIEIYQDGDYRDSVVNYKGVADTMYHFNKGELEIKYPRHRNKYKNATFGPPIYVK